MAQPLLAVRAVTSLFGPTRKAGGWGWVCQPHQGKVLCYPHGGKRKCYPHGERNIRR
jgi:hypothetical protein